MNIVDKLSRYCAIAQVYYIQDEYINSRDILNHGLTIAKKQIDSYHPSSLNFSAGPKYECLYLVCYHHLIQENFKLVEDLLVLMENTYSSLKALPILHSLSADVLFWLSSYKVFNYNILVFLLEKLEADVIKSIDLDNFLYRVRIIEELGRNGHRELSIIKLNALIPLIPLIKSGKEAKESCAIELFNNFLQLDAVDLVLSNFNTIDLSKKSEEVVYEMIARYYFRKDHDLVNLISRMNKHGKYLPDMNLKNIIDRDLRKYLSPEIVLPIIYLFLDQPVNLEILLNSSSSQYSN